MEVIDYEMNPNSLFPAVARNMGRSANNTSFFVGYIACKMEQVMGYMNDEFPSLIHKRESCGMN